MPNYNFLLHNTLTVSPTNLNGFGIEGGFSFNDETLLSTPYIINNNAYNDISNSPSQDSSVTYTSTPVDFSSIYRVRLSSIIVGTVRIIPEIRQMIFGNHFTNRQLTPSLIDLGFTVGDCDPFYFGIRRIKSYNGEISNPSTIAEYEDWVPCKIYYQSPLINESGINTKNHLGSTASVSAFRSIGYLGNNNQQGSAVYSFNATNNPDGLGPNSVVLSIVPKRDLDSSSQYELYVNSNLPSLELIPNASANPSIPNTPEI